MTTTLKRFTDAYATLTFAVYEPLILRWYSGLGVMSIADGYVKRSTSTTGAALTASTSSAMSVAEAVTESGSMEAAIGRVGATGHINAATPGFEDEPLFSLRPQLEITPTELFLGGRMAVGAPGGIGDRQPPVEGYRVEAPPLIYGNKAQPWVAPIDTATTTRELAQGYRAEIEKLLEEHKTGPIPAGELKKVLLAQAEIKLAGHGAKPTKEL